MTGLLPRWVLPVLMYHRIGAADGDDPALFVSESAFERQMTWLRESGYRALSIDQAVDTWNTGRVSGRTVLITFDDAFADTMAIASRVLTRVGMKATVFVPAEMIGQDVELRSPDDSSLASSHGTIADRDDLIEWLGRNLDIGSHSWSHVDLTTEPPDRILVEAQRSKARLEEIVERSIDDFCYPYTRHNAICRRLIGRCGYRSAFAGEPPISSVYAIPRMMIYPDDSPARFRRKVSGYYYWISAWHRRLGIGRHASRRDRARGMQ